MEVSRFLRLFHHRSPRPAYTKEYAGLVERGSTLHRQMRSGSSVVRSTRPGHGLKQKRWCDFASRQASGLIASQEKVQAKACGELPIQDCSIDALSIICR